MYRTLLKSIQKGAKLAPGAQTVALAVLTQKPVHQVPLRSPSGKQYQRIIPKILARVLFVSYLHRTLYGVAAELRSNKFYVGTAGVQMAGVVL